MGGDKLIDVEKIANELIEKNVRCPACKSLDMTASPKPFALPRYHDTIGGLDALDIAEVAVVQCNNCNYMLFFNAANYKTDT